MTDIDRVYKITATRAPEIAAIEGLDASFFDSFETITEITDHRIEFKIEKHLGKEPNTGDIVIANLASLTRDEFTRGTPMRVRFEAGYDNTPRLLFLGDLRHAANEPSGTEWSTKLQLGDGSRAYAEARVNRSYGPKTPLATILRDVAKAFGVALPPEVTASPELRTQLAAGEVLTGYASDELTRLLAPFGYEWSFQDGRLQILRFDEARAGVVRVISEDDGMIGSPTIDPPKITAPTKRSKKRKVPRITFQHLLYPELVPGERAEIRSRSLNLLCRLDAITHEGDTFGSDWTTTVEATEI